MLNNVCRTLSLGGTAVPFSQAHQRYPDSATKSRIRCITTQTWGMKQTYLLCLNDFFSQANGIANLKKEMYVKFRFGLVWGFFCSLIGSKTQKCQCKLSLKCRSKSRGGIPIHHPNYIKIKLSILGSASKVTWAGKSLYSTQFYSPNFISKPGGSLPARVRVLLVFKTVILQHIPYFS